MMQMLDQFEAGLMDRTLKVMTIVTDEKRRYPMELNKSQCSEMLLGTKDTTTFDERFNRHADLQNGFSTMNQKKKILIGKKLLLFSQKKIYIWENNLITGYKHIQTKRK